MLAAAPPPFAEDRPVLRAAYEWAAQLHASQLREADRAPFILHPLEVAALLSSRGFDEEVVAASLLHDVVEDTDTDLDEVRARFGDRIADLVATVTEDPTIDDYPARKAALRDQVAAAGPDGQAIYAADKVAKARELRAHATLTESFLEDPALRQRLEHYEESLATLREVGGPPSLVEALAFELWALRQLPPA